MKKLFSLLFFLPFNVVAQCPTWVGQSAETVSSLISALDSYVDVNEKQPSHENKGFKIFSDSRNFSMIRVSFKAEKPGDKVGPKEISSIYITGPVNNIDKLVGEYFEPKLKDCLKEKTAKWLKWGDMVLIMNVEGSKQGTSIKSIEIRKF